MKAAFTIALVLASCCVASGIARAQTPADLQVTVTNTPDAGASDQAGDTIVPGGDVVYTVKVTNAGAQRVEGVSIDGAMPAGIASAQWECSTISTCGTTNGAGRLEHRVDLDAGAEAIYRVTLTVPADYPATRPLSYQVTVKLPPGLLNRSAAGLTATDSDTPRAQGARPPSVPSRPGTTRSAGNVRGSPAAVSSPASGSLLGRGLGDSFATCGPEMFISQGPNSQTNTTLYLVDTSVSPVTLTTVGTGSVPYNALGFNPVDNSLYAIRIGTSVLYRINTDGTTTQASAGAIVGLPSPGSQDKESYNTGEISPDGFMYVTVNNGTTRMFRIDLRTPETPASIVATAINLSREVTGANFAWINGLLYTVNTDGKIATINPANGQVSLLPANNGALNIGALFGSPSGLFGSRNNPGGFYQIDIVTGKATRLSDAASVTTNDGAHCASASVVLETDIGVTKTNTPLQGPNDLPNDSYAPGTDVVYTIVVSNSGPVGVQNAPVSDPLPAGITAARWTCSATGTGACGAASGSGGLVDQVDMGVGDTVTYLFTITVPPNYSQSHASLSNTVTVTAPPGFADATANQANDTDTAAADLRVTKTTPSQSVISGETLVYTITVSNPGTSVVNGALLTDTADARLDCPAASATASCTAQGGATCPAATVPVANLLSATGITIPTLPPGGSAVFTLSCRVR